MADEQADPVATRLRMAPATDATRADVWDAFHATSSAEDFAAKIKDAKIPDAVKADLWDLKRQQSATVQVPMNQARVNGQDVPVSSRSWVDKAADWIPTVGGIVGGVLGGVPGAGLGGAAGEGVKQFAQHATEIPGALVDVARNAVQQPAATLKGALQGAGEGMLNASKEGALMAAGEGIGSGAVKAASSVGRYVMGEALNPTLTLARQFPELSQTAIDHALTVSKGGLNKARTLLTQAKATANAALDTAHAAGASVPVTAATDGLQKTFDEVALHSSDPVGTLSKLATLERKITAGRSGQLTMREADALKTSLQHEATALYKQAASGGGSSKTAVEMVAKADMAHALNMAIEDIATKAGAPGYQAANSVAQDLIGATRAISKQLLTNNRSAVGKVLTDMATPSTMGAVLAGGPGAAIGAAGTIAGKLATTPSNLSRISIFLSHPIVQDFLRQLPKPALTGLLSAFGSARGASSDPNTSLPSK